MKQKNFSPAITTGGYGDRNFSDEFLWAACELYVTAKDAKYLNGINLLPDERMPIPAWGQVRLLGYYALIKKRGAFREKRAGRPA